MARRALLSALALGVLIALMLPAAASAVVRVAVVTDQRTGLKRMEVAGGVGNDDIRLVQENQPNIPAIAIFIPPNDAVQLGAGCRTLGGPPRARCDTPGIGQILVNLAEGTRSPTTFDDTNAIDLTGVTQLHARRQRASAGPADRRSRARHDRRRPGPPAGAMRAAETSSARAGQRRHRRRPGQRHRPCRRGRRPLRRLPHAGLRHPLGRPGRDQVVARGTVTLATCSATTAPAGGRARPRSASRGRRRARGPARVLGHRRGPRPVRGDRGGRPGSTTRGRLHRQRRRRVPRGQRGLGSLRGRRRTRFAARSEGNDLLLARDEGGTRGSTAVRPCRRRPRGRRRGGPGRAELRDHRARPAGLAGPVGGGARAAVRGLPALRRRRRRRATSRRAATRATAPAGRQRPHPAGARDPDASGVRQARTDPDPRALRLPGADLLGRLTLARRRRAARAGRRAPGARLASGRVNVPWGTAAPPPCGRRGRSCGCFGRCAGSGRSRCARPSPRGTPAPGQARARAPLGAWSRSGSSASAAARATPAPRRQRPQHVVHDRRRGVPETEVELREPRHALARPRAHVGPPPVPHRGP